MHCIIYKFLTRRVMPAIHSKSKPVITIILHFAFSNYFRNIATSHCGEHAVFVDFLGITRRIFKRQSFDFIMCVTNVIWTRSRIEAYSMFHILLWLLYSIQICHIIVGNIVNIYLNKHAWMIKYMFLCKHTRHIRTEHTRRTAIPKKQLRVTIQ